MVQPCESRMRHAIADSWDTDELSFTGIAPAVVSAGAVSGAMNPKKKK